VTKRTLIISLLLALLLVALAPVNAQFDDDELEALDIVAAAFENVTSSAAVQMEGDLEIYQTISTQGITIENTILQEITGGWLAEDGAIVASSMLLNQGIEVIIPGAPATVGSMVMEMILLEESLYVQISETTGALAGTFPTGWFDLATGSVPAALETLNPEGLMEQARASVLYPINEDTVSAISELDPDVLLDDREARVFALEFNMDELAQTDAFAAGLNSLDLESLGVDLEAALDALLADASMSMTIWIGDEDGLVYRIDSELVMNVDLADLGVPGVTSGSLIQSALTSIVYSGFDKPFEIEAPDL
jgi:hypothetical protein